MYTLQGTSPRDQSQGLVPSCVPTLIATRVNDVTDVTKTGNGEWGMGNGEWGMGNGEWGMGNGEWGMGNGE